MKPPCEREWKTRFDAEALFLFKEAQEGCATQGHLAAVISRNLTRRNFLHPCVTMADTRKRGAPHHSAHSSVSTEAAAYDSDATVENEGSVPLAALAAMHRPQKKREVVAAPLLAAAPLAGHVAAPAAPVAAPAAAAPAAAAPAAAAPAAAAPAAAARAAATASPSAADAASDADDADAAERSAAAKLAARRRRADAELARLAFGCANAVGRKFAGGVCVPYGSGRRR